MKALTSKQTAIVTAIQRLKNDAGSHSPSLRSLTDAIPQLNIQVDACFLSNPYATELFLKYFQCDLIATGRIQSVLQNYPSQNSRIAKQLSRRLGTEPENIFIGNGAAEIIQAIIHNFVDHKLVVNLPTFSAYYEFATPGTEVVYYPLRKENDFCLDVESYIDFVRTEQPNAVVLINPNNPDGGYLCFDEIKYLLGELKDVDNIILDESFIHFAIEDGTQFRSAVRFINQFQNLIVVKSMSKDFGIAGIRAGYGVMSAAKVKRLLDDGYLWNSSGLAEYFFDLYSQDEFWQKYDEIRIKYVRETRKFVGELSQIKGIKTYPSWANFALVELLDGSIAFDVFAQLLVKQGVYTRNCSDKIGLDGEFLRIAARNTDENKKILAGLKSLFPGVQKPALNLDIYNIVA